MPMTGLRECIAEIAARLAAAGVENARGEAWLLLGAATGLERATLAAGALPTLGAEQETLLEALVRRRQRREPTAYILGAKEFWSLRFEVGPAVLIRVPRPRPWSRRPWNRSAIRRQRCASWIWARARAVSCWRRSCRARSGSASTTAPRRSPWPGATPSASAWRRAEFRQARWGAGLQERFALIVSNPPYVAQAEWARLQPEIRRFEPKALVAGPDGLGAYRALAPDCARLLAADGLCALEIGLGQGDAVAALLAVHGLM